MLVRASSVCAGFHCRSNTHTHTYTQPFSSSSFDWSPRGMLSDRKTYGFHSWDPPTQVDSGRCSCLIGRCRYHRGDRGRSRTHWCRPRTSPLSRQATEDSVMSKATKGGARKLLSFSHLFITPFHCLLIRQAAGLMVSWLKIINLFTAVSKMN